MAFPGSGDSCDLGCSLVPCNQDTEGTSVSSWEPQVTDRRETTTGEASARCQLQRATVFCSHSEAMFQFHKQNRNRGLCLQRWTVVCLVTR